ncbi:MAG: hypothetical protein ACI4L8_11805 [Candidatus Fimadaptatus sp.]
MTGSNAQGMRGTRLWISPAAGHTAQYAPWPCGAHGPLSASNAGQGLRRMCRFPWLTIVRSFAFCLPVLLFADRLPPVGMLMLPMTSAYVWTGLIGHNAMKKE